MVLSCDRLAFGSGSACEGEDTQLSRTAVTHEEDDETGDDRDGKHDGKHAELGVSYSTKTGI